MILKCFEIAWQDISRSLKESKTTQSNLWQQVWKAMHSRTEESLGLGLDRLKELLPHLLHAPTAPNGIVVIPPRGATVSPPDFACPLLGGQKRTTQDGGAATADVLFFPG